MTFLNRNASVSVTFVGGQVVVEVEAAGDLITVAVPLPESAPPPGHKVIRTHAETERMMRDALSDPANAAVSDRQMGIRLGVSKTVVGNYRRKMSEGKA